jgi:transposase
MSNDLILTSLPREKYKTWQVFAMEQDRLGHLWEAGIKSVQKLIKMTGLSRSTIYKNVKKLKEGDNPKRTPGSGRKCILKGNDRR